MSIGGRAQKQGYSLVKVEDAPGVADSVGDFGLRVSMFESTRLKPHKASLLDKLACVKKSGLSTYFVCLYFGVFAGGIA